MGGFPDLSSSMGNLLSGLSSAFAGLFASLLEAIGNALVGAYQAAISAGPLVLGLIALVLVGAAALAMRR